jgi:membrane-associated protease RseP (regulator of RpoE activity)
MKDPLEEAAVGVDRNAATKLMIAFVVGLVALGVLVPGSRTPLLIVAGIVLMVMLHEAGHYITAKRAGMKVTEFFLGFGPRLWSFRRGETEYGVKAFPLGGYVRIIGMSNLEQVDPEDEPRAYRNAPYGKRLVVVLAGVTVNIILALALFYVALAGQGHVATGPSTTVHTVEAGSAAAAAGLQRGDKIVSVAGQPTPSWTQLTNAIQSHGGDTVPVDVRRDGRLVSLTATPSVRSGVGFLGVSPTNDLRNVTVLSAVPESFRALGDVTASAGQGIGRLFSPAGVSSYSKNFTSQAPKAGSTADLERPRSLVGIVDEGSQMVGGDLWALLYLLGGISLVLALFNLLPVLPFDGGHAVVVVYEWAASKITGRRVQVDYRKLMPVAAVVLMLLVTLSLSAMFLDVRQAFGQ